MALQKSPCEEMHYTLKMHLITVCFVPKMVSLQYLPASGLTDKTNHPKEIIIIIISLTAGYTRLQFTLPVKCVWKKSLLLTKDALHWLKIQ